MKIIERYVPQTRDDLNRFIIVTGVSGSGKDYLLDKSVRQGGLPSGSRVVNFGTELFEELRVRNPQLRTRDDIKTQLTQGDVRQGVVHLVDRLIDQQPAVINVHVVFRQNESLILNPDSDRRLRPGHYLFVWSDPEQIQRWRAVDSSRVRQSESFDEIALHQDIALSVVSTMA